MEIKIKVGGVVKNGIICFDIPEQANSGQHILWSTGAVLFIC